MCDEFHCLPSEAWAEIARLPAGFLEQVIEYRRYAEAYRANEIDRSADGWRSTPMRMLAKELEHEIAAEEIAARG